MARSIYHSLAVIGASLLGSAHGQCFTSINSLALNEALNDDTSVRRTHTLCANSEYFVGTLNVDNELVEGSGQDIIPIRDNIHIKCGDDGRRANKCLVRGGDVHVDGTNYFGISQETVRDVLIEGLTFINPGRHMAVFNKPGNVVFRDCEFRDSQQTLIPILLDYFDDDSSQNTELSLTFENCLFDNNTFTGKPAQPAVVVGNSLQNRIIIQNSVFSNNDYVTNNTDSSSISFLVETFGPLTMTSNCFANNSIGVSPVITYGPEFLLADNYQSESRGARCPLASHYETAAQYRSQQPRCVDFDATTCLAAADVSSPAPVVTPTATSPTGSPLSSPSTAPQPTVSPAGSTPTSPPTGSPLSSPSTVPQPTVSPVSTPTNPPTGSPSQNPTMGATAAAMSDTAAPTMIREVTTTVQPTSTVENVTNNDITTSAAAAPTRSYLGCLPLAALSIVLLLGR